MARHLLTSRSDYVTVPVPGIGTPFSAFCRYRPWSTATASLIGMFRSGDPTHSQQMAYTPTTLVIQTQRIGATGTATLTLTPVIGQWTAAGMVFASTASRTVYGGKNQKATNTSVVADPDNIDEFLIGAFRSGGGSTLTPRANTEFADVAFWVGVALTDDEMFSMMRGVSPRLIRPANLAYFCELVGRDRNEPALTQGGMAGKVTTAFNNFPTLYGPELFDMGDDDAAVAVIPGGGSILRSTIIESPLLKSRMVA